MKPSARLRTSPRSFSDNVVKSAPSIRTLPPVGASSPPRRWSSVLFPDPDAPTIATRSPRATARSTPSSTGTSSGPLTYVFASARHSSTGCSLRGSFIAERLGRVDLRRAPRGVDRRDERQHERDDANRDDIRALQVGRQLADVVDGLVEKLDVEEPFERG